MYKFQGEQYSLEEVQAAANKANSTVEDYLKKHDITEVPTVGKQNDVVVQDATVTSVPGQASESMELESVDISLDSPEPKKSSSARQRFNQRKLDQKEAQEQINIDGLKAEAVVATSEIEKRIQEIPEQDIINLQANNYFGPVKARDHKTSVSGQAMGQMGPVVSFQNTFTSDESYNNYLKNTLGNKYDQYLGFLKNNTITPYSEENEVELQTQYDVAEREVQNKVYNNSLFNVPEDVQEYMTPSPKFASGAESTDAQKFLLEEQSKTLEVNLENYNTARKQWEEEATPLNEEINKIKDQIDRFQFYVLGASEDQINQYNNLINTYNSKVTNWEEKGFNELPVYLNDQYKLIDSQQKNYSEMLNDTRKSLVSADLFEKNLLKDYTASARVGRAFDEFFTQSIVNTVDLISETALTATKYLANPGSPLSFTPLAPLSFLNSPENSKKLDSLIETIKTDNKNYNLKMLSKREKIPTAPSIDDIGKNGISVWDWTSISLQDNSPTIVTTFIPSTLAIKGTSAVSKATKAGTGLKEALQTQKKLWLAGKRTTQTVFFTAETGGKFGDIQTDEASREQEIKTLYSRLGDVENLEEKSVIYDRIQELEEIKDYSLLQKAFTSFSAGATATYFETIGTLKMLQPAKDLSRVIGTTAAKKKLYKSPVNFGANVIGKTISGLKSLPKNVSVELLEETGTAITHNGLDIAVLGENKSMFEGINKDFIANTLVSTIGIMAPKTGGNVVNIVKSEFRTRNEVINNQKLASELIQLEESTTSENSANLRARKKEILKQLALSDAISLHKLKYMSPDQIMEVADINRQLRETSKKLTQLGSLGDVSNAENQRVKNQLEKERINLTASRQEILDSKQRSTTQKAKNITEALGAAVRNSEASYWYGVNSFYDEIAMTQMGDGDYISIDGEIQEDGSIKYDNLDEQLAKYKNVTVKDENGKDVNALEYLKTNIEQGNFNGTKIGKDIIINQAVIDRSIALAPTSTSAQYAALAPLEELFHLSVAEKNIKFDQTAKTAVQEAENILLEKKELGVISDKDYEGLQRRFDLYRDGKDFDAEEFIAQINNAIALGAVNRSDIESMPSFKKFLNNSIRSTFGDMSWMLSLETSDDVFNLVKNFQTDVGKGVTFQAPDDEEIKESLTADDSAKVNKIYQESGIAGAMDILDLLRPTARGLAQRYRNRPNYDEALVIDEIMTGKRGMLDVILDYDKKVKEGQEMGPLSGYINNSFSTKTGFKRYIDAAEKIVGKEFTEDVSEAKGIAAGDYGSIDTEETKPVSARGKALAKKPTETVVYSDEILSNVGVANTKALEDRITEEIQIAFKGKDISRFKELKDIPENITQLYADMFGLSTVDGIVDFKRNFPKLDEDAVRKIRTFLSRNAEDDFRRFPKTKDDKKKATGVKQTKLGKVMYDAKDNLVGTLKQYKDILQGKNITLPAYNGTMVEFNRLDESGEKLPLYRDSQHYKAALKFHIQNRIAENVMPDKAQRLSAGLKFSKATKPKDIDKKLQEIAVATDINQAAKIAGIKGKVTVDDNNRLEKQEQMQQAIIDAEIPSWMFEASRFGNFARRKVDGKYVNIPARGGLYYGKSDPAFQAALALSKVNDSKYDIKPPKRVNVNKAFTEQGQKQGKENLEALKFVANKLTDAVAKNQMPVEIAALYISSGYQATSGIIKIAAPFKYKSKTFEYGTTPNQNKGDKFREEHNPPASVIGANLIYGIANNDMTTILTAVTKNYYQTQLSKADDQKIDESDLASKLPEGFSILDNSIIRLIDSGIDMNSLVNEQTGKTVAEELGVSLKSSDINVDTIFEQNKILKEVLSGDITAKTGQDRLNQFAKLKSIPKAAISNNNENSTIKFSKKVPNQEVLDNLSNADQAMSNAKNPNALVKKIRVFDFDDTLARSNSKVLYEMPDGKTGKLNATQFAARAGELEAEGAVFDFAEFSKVIDGKKGPVFKAIENIVAKRGAEDVFILTARPANAASAIKEFMDALGVNLPIKNIVGLGDGKAEAKARWITAKAAEGYNDFFFVDDAYKNVKAVQDALNVFDVKSKTQQAYIKFNRAEKLSKEFNDILENKTGIASEKRYGKVKAEVAGASKGRFKFFIPPSAEDFVGLLYSTLGKGKLGDEQMAWYKAHLLNPYGRAMNELSSARIALMNDYKQLKKQLKVAPKNLRKKVPGEPYTREQAIRVYVWGKQGMEIPGISKSDLKDLTEYVSNNADLQVFADQLITLLKGDQYAKPKEGWPAGTITTDLLEALNTTKRAKYLEEWQNNVNAIFDEANLNKLQAAYGKDYRKALENMLARMKSGRNRNFPGDSLTGRFTDWLTGSIGTIMFFNTRSALLQTISAVNFVNFTDNNVLAAGKAFANQKQFWSDFMTLINSDFLKERRGGLRINVNEADIADMAKKGGVRGVISKLLEIGFAPTQIADSFAIASGGATFYRNRIKTYTKQGLTDKQAQDKAFVDFRETAEEAQQSSRPDRISMQQAGPLVY